MSIAEQLNSLRGLADEAGRFQEEQKARIAELEAENERLSRFPAVALGCSGLRAKLTEMTSSRDYWQDETMKLRAERRTP